MPERQVSPHIVRSRKRSFDEHEKYGINISVNVLYIKDYLKTNRVPAYLLDGDVIRQGLSSDLGFSNNDRTENIRRIGEVSRLMADSGVVCMRMLHKMKLPYLHFRCL